MRNESSSSRRRVSTEYRAQNPIETTVSVIPTGSPVAPGWYTTSSTPAIATATATASAGGMCSRSTSVASSMMATGSRAHSNTDMLAVMVVKPTRPRAYAIPGLRTPSAAR